MTLDEALELARDIAAGGRADLIGIGRFVPIAELGPDRPWGCSVLVHGADKPRVVWSLVEYVELFADPPAADPSPPLDPHHPTQQLSLF